MFVCMPMLVMYQDIDQFLRLVELSDLAIYSTAFKIAEMLPRPGAGCMNAVRPD